MRRLLVVMGTLGCAAVMSSAACGGTGSGGMGGSGYGGAGAGTAGSSGAVTKAQVITCPATVAATLEVSEPSTGMYMYNPSTVAIHAGEVIAFHNTSDDTPHTFTSGTSPAPDGTWDTGSVAIGATACVQVNAAGTYPFFCKFHPTSMKGTATVQ